MARSSRPVRIYNPELDRSSVVLESSFKAVWEPRGWRLESENEATVTGNATDYFDEEDDDTDI